MHDQFNLQTIETNGIRLRAAVEGEGPLVIMVHGWPELWYSWRHQIRPVADAGYRVVAIDMRGYGGSDKPHPIEAYDMTTLIADVTGVIDAFGEQKAVLVGHDWGAPIVWNTAALRPERVAAVAGLSVPYRPRGEVSQIAIWQQLYEGRFFYQTYFQQEGVAEAEMEADVRATIRKLYFAGSGDAPSPEYWSDRPPGTTRLLEGLIDPDPFPAWLTNADLDYFVAAFEAGGFRGPVNRYRNQERDFHALPGMGAAPVTPPSCFIAGTEDIVRRFVRTFDPYENVHSNCTDFRGKTMIDGIGHWVQQEAPGPVTSALLQFLASLD
ncbi:MAG: alpha/beta hydrolase [Pseudomonadota bacterium]